MGKNKGKKKQQQSQGDQPAAPAQEQQPGPSRETSQPPEGQPKKGMKGPPQEQPKQQDDRRGPRQDQAQQQGQRRPEDPSRQQQRGGQPQQLQRQQGPQGQQQAQARASQPSPQQSSPQHVGRQPGPQSFPVQQQQQAWAPQQAGGPPPQQSSIPPQQAWARPQGHPGPRPGPPQGFQPPSQRLQGPTQGYQGPPQGYQGQPQGYQGPPQGYQGPPLGHKGPPQGYQGPPQGYQGPPQGYQGPPQRFQGPPQGSQGPPQRFQGRPQGPPQGSQGPPQGSQGPPQGSQVPSQGPPQGSQGPPQRVQGPSQGLQGPPQGSQGPTPGFQGSSQESQEPLQKIKGSSQKPAGKGQQRQQAPRTSPDQQPSRSSVPSVAGVTSGVTGLELSRRDAGDAGIVSANKRPPGTKGRPIKVESNHLQLNLGSLKTAYHYDVTIDPDKPKKYMRPAVTSFMRQHFPKRWPAFDGKKNLYTSSPLTDNLNDFFEGEVSLREEDGREKKFKIEIKFANKVDLTLLHDMLKSPVTPQEAIQVVDIVLRMAPVESCFPVGRSFFMKPDRIIDLGQGMEMYHGFYQSAIRGWKPLLNVDVAHKAFPKDINVVDALVDLLNTGRQEFRRDDLRSLNPMQEEILEKYIKTLRVNYQIPNHPESRKGYRVNGLGTCAQNATFNHENRNITIVEYFNRVKNYKIKYPMLPTLWVGNMQRADKILLPLELCVICVGQALNRKMTDLQTSKMIRQAATDTTTRKRKIVDGIQRANYNANPCIKEFGFSVGNEFQKLTARILDPPVLQYKNSTVRVNKGVWRNDSFLTGVTINKWTIVNACKWPPRPDDYKNMIDMFERSGRECGMTFASRATEPFKNIAGRQSYSDIEQYFKQEKGKFDVIFVIVPDSGPQYSFVKKAAEIAVGCLTQCLKSNTVSRKMNQQTAVNILLKVNSKLNGINHTFSANTKPNILKRPVMIMGADVTHPGPDARDIPSVAAVTASHDPKAFQYNICWRLQNPRMEIIEDLEVIVQEHLKFFFKQTKVKPEAIVFFRDGVSEGQFEQVKNAEVRAIRSACKKMQADGYEPKITFLVVQKRHHTRLFPTNPKDSHDRNLNVPAGTCVDTDITHPFMQDFYLVSHASIQGVAKPTKYCTLWDDNNMDNDQVEELSYYLCHMFSRCNRSVSYPAPTYYAHLAAARAKVYIENDRLNMDKLREEFSKYQIKDEIRKDLPMFFV